MPEPVAPVPGGAAGGRGGAVPIAIVGMSALFPGAGDLGAFWRNIVGGVDAVGAIPPGRFDVEDYFAAPSAAGGLGGSGVSGLSGQGGQGGSGGSAADGGAFYCRRGGFVDDLAAFDPTAFGIVPNAVDWAEPDQLLALRLTAEAITDAGGADRLGDADRVGVVLGRGGYVGSGVARLEQRVRTSRQLVTTLREVLPDLPADAVERVRAAFCDQLGPVRAEASIGLVPNLAASRIANRLDLRGPAYTVDAACASSLIAVESALRDLGSHRTDAMIVGGAHLVHEASFWSVFTLLRALSPSEVIRPFDRRADGIVIGEGVGMLVLRRLDDARRDGDRVYAVLRGAGASSDGRGASLMAPDTSGQVLAVRRAWADAGLDPTAPGAIGLLEAHGTATPAGDAVELATLAEVFGQAAAADVGGIGLGSVKSMIGHAMPAAGAAGLIKTALALHHRTLPPTLHCDEPHPAFAASRFAPVRTATPWAEPAGGGPRRAGVNAFGFGGINAHLVVEEAPPDIPVTAARTFPAPTAASSAAASPSGMVVSSGGVSSGELGADADAERVLLLAGSGPDDLLAQLDRPDAELLDRDDAAAPPTGGPWRLALVAPNARRLALARTAVGRGTPWRGRNDLWFSPTGLLDPANPAGAGQTAFLFCGLEDNFTPRVDDVCDHFGLDGPNATDTAVLGRHGVASIEVGRILDLALRRLGIVPDLVGGHSIGEWNAMISCGLVTDAFADSFIAGFDPASLEVPGVAFGALGCGAEQAGAVIAHLDEVVLSHDNCPHQSIICGREDSVRAALDELRRAGVLGRLLPFRSGFHSPFFEPYQDVARTAIDATTFAEATVPIWSATTAAPYPRDHDEVRDLTLRHLVAPVRFRELLDELYASGARAFVQVGVGSIAGFVDDTLRGREHLSLVSNTPKRSGLEQLRRVAAALWAEGAAPRLDLLPCRTRPTPPAPPVVTGAPVTPPGRRVQLPRGGGGPEAHQGRS
ncbi:beta-ketoacyl synthase N-terminal-like domain-containing protein, partial [Candidatus Frankia nodulisporulans]|uniref:beta-ketoacyl synthase N-terminal-like domain-containing protein n=1 Tax=Candidatus Frankia nodulisporulans TaxID=2060052 RepID=UPI0037042ADE